MINVKLLELRIRVNLSQEEISKRLGIARTTYASYEQGKREPDIDMIRKIANFHGIEPGVLIEETKNKKERDESTLYHPSISLINKLITQHGADFSDPEAAEMLENLIKFVAKNQKRN